MKPACADFSKEHLQTVQKVCIILAEFQKGTRNTEQRNLISTDSNHRVSTLNNHEELVTTKISKIFVKQTQEK